MQNSKPDRWHVDPTGKPGTVALLVNPVTTTGPRDIAIIQRIASSLHAVDLAMTSPDDPGGAKQIERWFRLGVSAIAVIGGDGTLRSLLCALHQAGRVHDFEIVLLDGGSFGLAAKMLGARDGWQRVLDAHDCSLPVRYESVGLPTLQTATGLGFLVGVGAGASVSRDFQSSRRTRSQLVGYVAARVMEAVVGGESVSLLSGYRGALSYDGVVTPGERWIAVFITSLPQLHRSKGNNPGRGPLFSIALRLDPSVNRAPHLLDLIAGRWASEARASGTVLLESKEPFDVLFDGEIQQAESRVSVRPGPTLRAWVPCRVTSSPRRVTPREHVSSPFVFAEGT